MLPIKAGVVDSTTSIYNIHTIIPAIIKIIPLK